MASKPGIRSSEVPAELALTGECIFRHCKMHFSLQKGQNKSKTKIVDLLLLEQDVYIRLLQLRMRSFRLVRLNYTGAMFKKKLFPEPPLYGEIDDRGRLKRQADFRH